MTKNPLNERAICLNGSSDNPIKKASTLKRISTNGLTNQNSPIAGFTPKLSFSTGKSPFTNTGKSLIIEYQLFSIHQKEISPRGDSFSPRRESFSPRRDLFPPWGEWWKMNRKSFVMINKDCLLRNKAFASGYKAIIFVRTLFRKWKRAFPISRELFRQRGETSYFGKNCMVLN